MSPPREIVNHFAGQPRHAIAMRPKTSADRLPGRRAWTVDLHDDGRSLRQHARAVEHHLRFGPFDVHLDDVGRWQIEIERRNAATVDGDVRTVGTVACESRKALRVRLERVNLTRLPDERSTEHGEVPDVR